jgi:hypothetical protein
MVRRARVASVISEGCGERADGPFNTLEGKLDMALCEDYGTCGKGSIVYNWISEIVHHFILETRS